MHLVPPFPRENFNEGRWKFILSGDPFVRRCRTEGGERRLGRGMGGLTSRPSFVSRWVPASNWDMLQPVNGSKRMGPYPDASASSPKAHQPSRCSKPRSLDGGAKRTGEGSPEAPRVSSCTNTHTHTARPLVYSLPYMNTNGFKPFIDLLGESSRC